MHKLIKKDYNKRTFFFFFVVFTTFWLKEKYIPYNINDNILLNVKRS